MTDLIINRIQVSSFAKIFALYSLFMSILVIIVDLLDKLISGNSSFVGENTWASWFIYIIILIILAPILGYILGLIMGWFINLALKVSDGLKLEVK
jgi:hypothetical protein